MIKSISITSARIFIHWLSSDCTYVIIPISWQ